MKSIIITNIDDETHKDLRLYCLRRDISMVQVLRNGIKKLVEHERNEVAKTVSECFTPTE